MTVYFAEKLQKPPSPGASATEIYRWNYRVFELLNGIQKILASQVEAAPAGTIAGSDTQTILDNITGLLENHDARHANGGADEISVSGLSGELADAQTPKVHTQAFSTITDTPTTRAGYGITDAAPSTEGVTNGNLHDHAGGDGAQIDHAGLYNLTTGDPHTQYQQESEKDSANGYAGLNSSSRITKGADTTDDLIIDIATKGLVLKDTQATPHYWRVTISNAGAIVTADLGVTKP